MRPPEAPPLLLIVAYRSEEASSSAVLSRFLSANPGSEQWTEIEVDRLDPSEARDLASALLAGARLDPEAAAETIARESSGNPFFLGELARSVRGSEEEAATLADADSVTEITLDGVLRSRVTRLLAAG